jgi:hypothetical protein
MAEIGSRPRTAQPADGLGYLLRSDPPGVFDWFGLAEFARTRLAPHFKDFTPPKLSQFECLTSSLGTHPPTWHTKEFWAEEGLSLETQGIYHALHSSRQKHGRIARSGPLPQYGPWWEDHVAKLAPGFPELPEQTRGVLYAWGLTRAGEWVLIQVAYRHGPGYKDRGTEEATGWGIRRSDLREIAVYTRVGPRSIREKLIATLDQWVENRSRQLRRIRWDQRAFQVEDYALAVLEGRVSASTSRVLN